VRGCAGDGGDGEWYRFASPVVSQISPSFSVFKCFPLFSFQNLPPSPVSASFLLASLFSQKILLPESVVGLSPSPKFLPPFLPFSSPSIYKQKEREFPPALSHRGAGGAGLPYLCRVRWPPVCRHGASVSSIIVAGYGLCHSALFHGLAKLGEREGEGER